MKRSHKYVAEGRGRIQSDISAQLTMLVENGKLDGSGAQAHPNTQADKWFLWAEDTNISCMMV